MSFSRILIPILIIFMIFGLLTTLNGEKLQPGIKGTITDKTTGKPIANAVVELPGTTFKTTTGADGSYFIANVPEGSYLMSVRSGGYANAKIIRVVVEKNKISVLDLALNRLAPGEAQKMQAIFASEIQKFESLLATLTGKITSSKDGKPIPGVAVQIEGTRIGALTDSDGNFIVMNIPPGEHKAKIRIVGFKTKTIDGLELKAQGTTELKVSIDEAEIEYGEQSVMAEREAIAGEPSLRVKSHHYLLSQNAPNPSSGQWLPHGGTTPPNGEPYSGTFFKNYGVNPFVDTEDDHFSTFAIDVDDASYSVARGYIEGGNLPPNDAIRTEEFVNFFNYDYPAPERDKFKLYIEGAPSKFGQNADMLRIGIKGQEINPVDRKPAVLTFVIDVSGSMGIDSRLGLVKRALRLLVDQLREDDLVGIAVYGSRGKKYMDHTSIRDKDDILFAIDALQTGGSTNAEEGIKIGYKMASENFKEGAINRIILCSDGVANVGRTGPDAILKEIKEYVEKGITLTTVGFGMANYNDILMEQLGNKGNGHFAYVDNLEQARRIFVQNLTGTLQVIAKDVKIQIDFDPGKVRSYRLLGYENRDVDDDKFRDDKEDGGEIGSGHDVTALYEIKFKDGASGKFATLFVRYKNPDADDEVTESSFPLEKNQIKSNFAETSSSFRLAACAAEFAEILRESYWAKDGDMGEVLKLAQELSYENKDDDDIIEFTAMVSRAKKLWDEKEMLSKGN